jgi:acyl-CoA ligase (AMP-forming) (exosortase A-associated)
MTYRELEDRSRKVASALTQLGLQRGDRVATYLQNCPEVVEVAIACSRIGAICAPLNPLLKTRQLVHMLGNCGARAIITSDALLPVVESCAAQGVVIEHIVVCDGERPSPPALMTYDRLLAAGTNEIPQVSCIDNDPVLILYTSSSTGSAKGVVVSHRNVVSGAASVSAYLGNTRDDRILVALPLSFDYGFSQVTTALFVGACAVLINYSTATALVDAVEVEAITALAGVPTMWTQLATTAWPASACATLRYVTNSGGVIAPATLRQLKERIPQARIFRMYGLTEAFRSTYLDPAEVDHRPHSIGKAIPNQEVLVLRPDGTECAADEEGELVHRGSLVTLGYWNDPASTKTRFRPLPRRASAGLTDEIAVWSGDIVKRDSDGYLYFVGRRDQQIKTSGYRVSPTEIEEAAMEVPGVAEAVVVGLPDDRLGQRLALAFVGDGRDVEKLAEDLRQHCRKQLPTFMVPSHIVAASSLPRTPNGKHDRAAAQAQIIEQLSTKDRQSPA